ncbi:retrovirus-related pol polyprotein from transposon TNT 1-94 [Tanacetum coccineum]
MKSSPICLLSKALKTKSWLWHCRLSHLNFGTINQLAKEGLVKGLPKLKYTRYQLCSAYQMGKSKKECHKPKPEPSTNEKLQMLHMDLCGPIRVESINGKRYILVIVDDHSRFTWVKFLRTKDEAPEIIIKFWKQAQVSLQATVRYLRTDNNTEFINQTLRAYTEDVGITHHTSGRRKGEQKHICVLEFYFNKKWQKKGKRKEGKFRRLFLFKSFLHIWSGGGEKGESVLLTEMYPHFFHHGESFIPTNILMSSFFSK